MCTAVFEIVGKCRIVKRMVARCEHPSVRGAEVFRHQTVREFSRPPAPIKMDGGKYCNRASVFRMIKFYQKFPDREKVATLSQQLTWSHFVELLPIKDDLKMDFYAAMCKSERWTVRTLRDRKNSLLYERTAIILFLFNYTEIINMNGYITAQEAADKWGITVRQVQSLCKQERIKGAVMLSRIWIIPEDAEKPTITRTRKAFGTK